MAILGNFLEFMCTSLISGNRGTRKSIGERSMDRGENETDYSVIKDVAAIIEQM